MHSGPLPTPEDLLKYNEAVPDAAERIVRQAEKEQTFRHRVIDRNQLIEVLRVFLSFVTAMSLIGVAGLATWLGHIGIAIPLGTAGLASLLLRRFLESKSDE